MNTNQIMEIEGRRFIKCSDYDQSLVKDTDDGAVMTIGGEEIPLLDMAYTMKLVQPASTDEKLRPAKGKFVVLLDETDPLSDVTEELNLFPLTIISYGFRNFGPGAYSSKEKAGLVCYSTDGLVPSPRCETPLNHACAEATISGEQIIRRVVCPKASWVNGVKPECMQVINVAFFDLDRLIPVTMQMHGVAITAWNALQRSYKTARNTARIRKKSISSYFIKATIDDRGQYVCPIFTLTSDEEHDPLKFLPVSKWYKENLFTRKIVAEDTNTEIKPVTVNISPSESHGVDIPA